MQTSFWRSHLSGNTCGSTRCTRQQYRFHCNGPHNITTEAVYPLSMSICWPIYWIYCSSTFFPRRWSAQFSFPWKAHESAMSCHKCMLETSIAMLIRLYLWDRWLILRDHVKCYHLISKKLLNDRRFSWNNVPKFRCAYQNTKKCEEGT